MKWRLKSLEDNRHPFISPRNHVSELMPAHVHFQSRTCRTFFRLIFLEEEMQRRSAIQEDMLGMRGGAKELSTARTDDLKSERKSVV
mgnify:CR=1 FL=1